MEDAEPTRLVIRPYEGMGPVRFGMLPGAVETVLGRRPDRLRRGEDRSDRWIYDDVWLAVDFSPWDGGCHFIECASPAVPAVAGVEELELVGAADAVLAELAGRGYALRHGSSEEGSADTTYVDALGVVLWYPGGEMESVAAWRRGYWDDGVPT